MQKTFLIFFCLFFLLPGCHAQVKQELAEPPKNSDPYSWDFGRVEEGAVLKHAFILKNDTQKTLTIKDINTSCGCTVSRVKKKVLSPGESTAIEVQFNTKGYSGLAQQFIYVHTDDFDNPVLRFIIKAEIIK